MLNVRCREGDLAITVQAYNPENIGKIVRILRSKGVGPWPDLEGAHQIWEIVSATPGVQLVYSINDKPFYEVKGECPDCFLRPLPKESNNVSQEHCQTEGHEQELELCDV
jgi:hypothetical protein